MAQPKILEGTGEELEPVLKQHPHERFRLIRLSQRRGLPNQEAEAQAFPPNQEIEQFRAQGLQGVGMFAHVPGGSEEFAREKQEEIEREDRPRG